MIPEKHDALRQKARGRIHELQRHPDGRVLREHALEVVLLAPVTREDREQREPLPCRGRLAEELVVVRTDCAPDLRL